MGLNLWQIMAGNKFSVCLKDIQAVARTTQEVSEYLKAVDDDAGGWLPLLSKITDKILFIRIYQHFSTL